MHLSSPHTCCMPRPSNYSWFYHPKFWVNSTDHWASHYVVFSTLLLPRTSWAQIFSSTAHYQTPSAYVPPSKSANKFLTQTKNWKNNNSIYLDLYIFGYQTGRQKVLYRMLVSIHGLQSDLNFFRDTILIRQGCYKIFRLFRPFKTGLVSIFVRHINIRTNIIGNRLPSDYKIHRFNPFKEVNSLHTENRTKYVHQLEETM